MQKIERNTAGRIDKFAIAKYNKMQKAVNNLRDSKTNTETERAQCRKSKTARCLKNCWLTQKTAGGAVIFDIIAELSPQFHLLFAKIFVWRKKYDFAVRNAQSCP